MENAITARPMVYKEARECADRINENMNDIRHLVYDLYMREGWSALGHKTWRDCVTTEFKLSQSYLYFQLEAAKTERNLSTIVEKADRIPETQLRPLSKLEHAQQREAWQQAVATAPDGKVTAAHVYKIVKDMTMPEKPKPKPNQPIVKQELVSPEFQAAFDQMYVELKNASAMKWKTTSHRAAVGMMQNLLTIAEQLGR